MEKDFFMCTVMVPADKRALVDKAFAGEEFNSGVLFAADFVGKEAMLDKAGAVAIGSAIGMAFHRALVERET
jgi:hypothetical protein